MSKQQDNIRNRERRAQKAERVYVASKVVSVFNAAASLSSEGKITHRAERCSQTVRVVEIHENGHEATIRNVFIRIDRIDLRRMETLANAMEQHTTIYNQLEIEKTMASPTERIRIQQQQEHLRPTVCSSWHELRDLCTKFTMVAPESSFLKNLCANFVQVITQQS